MRAAHPESESFNYAPATTLDNMSSILLTGGGAAGSADGDFHHGTTHAMINPTNPETSMNHNMSDHMMVHNFQQEVMDMDQNVNGGQFQSQDAIAAENDHLH